MNTLNRHEGRLGRDLVRKYSNIVRHTCGMREHPVCVDGYDINTTDCFDIDLWM